MSVKFLLVILLIIVLAIVGPMFFTGNSISLFYLPNWLLYYAGLHILFCVVFYLWNKQAKDND